MIRTLSFLAPNTKSLSVLKKPIRIISCLAPLDGFIERCLATCVLRDETTPDAVTSSSRLEGQAINCIEAVVVKFGAGPMLIFQKRRSSL